MALRLNHRAIGPLRQEDECQATAGCVSVRSQSQNWAAYFDTSTTSQTALEQ